MFRYVWPVLSTVLALGCPPFAPRFCNASIQGEVVGESGLLEAVRTGLRSNPSLLGYGELKAEVVNSVWRVDSSERRVGDETRTLASVSLKWDGEKVRWDYQITSLTGQKLEVTIDQVTGRIIRVGQRITRYVPRSRHVLIADEPQKNPIPPELHIDPRELGFVNPFAWLDLLGERPGPIAGRIAKYVVSRRGDYDIVILCHTHTGHVSTIVCSLKSCGNITEYESIPKNGPGWKGHFYWENQPDGSCFLREHEHIQFFNGRTSEPYRRFSVKIPEFAKRRPPDALFTFESLGVAPNTRIEDLAAGKTYNFMPTGDSGVSSATLEKEAEIIGSKGFGSRKK